MVNNSLMFEHGTKYPVKNLKLVIIFISLYLRKVHGPFIDHTSHIILKPVPLVEARGVISHCSYLVFISHSKRYVFGEAICVLLLIIILL